MYLKQQALHYNIRVVQVIGKRKVKRRIKREILQANPDTMPERCPSRETFCMRSWNTTNKKNAYLKHNMPNYHGSDLSR